MVREPLYSLDEEEKITVSIDGHNFNCYRNSIPIPDVNLKIARVAYPLEKGDKAQEILDKAIYGDHILEIVVDIYGIQKWIYQGKVMEYIEDVEEWLRMDLTIKLCGSFKYIRKNENGDESLIIERTF